MIAQLTGTVVSVHGMDVVLDVAGVGYLVSVPLSSMSHVSTAGERVTLLTIMLVREDAMQLVGFATHAEREAFRLLTSIQGIGGRIALGIISASTLDDLRSAILRGNLPALQRLPGVGKKTAERIVIELRDKILTVLPDGTAESPLGSPLHQLSQMADDAVSALQALGYTRAAAEKSVKAVLATEPSLSSEDLIRKALQLSSRG
ncbi:MAG: Holliday junction branch migration protein RuvA [bacterium]|nr:Holliday junction branch migration protein RuvA [bacterium]